MLRGTACDHSHETSAAGTHVPFHVSHCVSCVVILSLTTYMRGRGICERRVSPGQGRASRTVSRMAAKANSKLSRGMSRILRHDPPASIDASGWVPVADLIKRLGGKVAEADIARVVQEDAKGRYQVH